MIYARSKPTGWVCTLLSWHMQTARLTAMQLPAVLMVRDMKHQM